MKRVWDESRNGIADKCKNEWAHLWEGVDSCSHPRVLFTDNARMLAHSSAEICGFSLYRSLWQSVLECADIRALSVNKTDPDQKWQTRLSDQYACAPGRHAVCMRTRKSTDTRTRKSRSTHAHPEVTLTRAPGSHTVRMRTWKSLRINPCQIALYIYHFIETSFKDKVSKMWLPYSHYCYLKHSSYAFQILGNKMHYWFTYKYLD